MTLLRALNLTAGYGGVAVVADLDLEVRAGEVVCLLGPNGAGKTTTVLALARALPVMSGRLTWKGSYATVALHKRARQGMALITEERAVLMDLTVAENLRLGRGRVERALALMPELRPLLRRRVGTLSGGEQQILAV